MTPWEQLGLQKHSYFRRLKRGWDPNVALSRGRYERSLEPVRRPPKPRRTRVDNERPEAPYWWPLSEDQRVVNRVLRAWKPPA